MSKFYKLIGSGWKTYAVSAAVIILALWDWYSGSNSMSDKALLIGGILAATLRHALKTSAVDLASKITSLIVDVLKDVNDIKTVDTVKKALSVDPALVDQYKIDAIKTVKDAENLISAIKKQ